MSHDLDPPPSTAEINEGGGTNVIWKTWLYNLYEKIKGFSDNQTRSIILTIDDYRKGATGPSDATVGSTPTIPVLLFNATNELLSLHTVMPINWDKGADCSIDFVWSLSSNETNDDVLSITVDYVAVRKNTTGAGIAKTSTQLTPTLTLTTANGLAIGDIYTMSATLSASDSDNGFSFGDNTTGFCFEFHLTNTTAVADIHFVGGCVNYKILPN